MADDSPTPSVAGIEAAVASLRKEAACWDVASNTVHGPAVGKLLRNAADMLTHLHAALATLTARIASHGNPCHVCHTTSGEHVSHCSAAGDGLDRLMAERDEWRRRAEAAEEMVKIERDAAECLQTEFDLLEDVDEKRVAAEQRARTLEAALLDGCAALRTAEPGRRIAALRNMEAALAKSKEPS